MSFQNVSLLGDTFIKKSEGLELEIYPDSEGYDTVGNGHKLIFPQDQWIIDEGGVITQAQADALYSDDKFYVEVYLNHVICVNWDISPTQYEFDALADYTFEYGTSIQTRFPDTFDIFRSGDRGKIVFALRNWFNNANPNKDDQLLTTRRQREVLLFRDGHYG